MGGDGAAITPTSGFSYRKTECFLIIGDSPFFCQAGFVFKRDGMHGEQSLEHGSKDFHRKAVVVEIVVEAFGVLPCEDSDFAPDHGITAGDGIRAILPPRCGKGFDALSQQGSQEQQQK